MKRHRLIPGGNHIDCTQKLGTIHKYLLRPDPLAISHISKWWHSKDSPFQGMFLQNILHSDVQYRSKLLTHYNSYFPEKNRLLITTYGQNYNKIGNWWKMIIYIGRCWHPALFHRRSRGCKRDNLIQKWRLYTELGGGDLDPTSIPDCRCLDIFCILCVTPVCASLIIMFLFDVCALNGYFFLKASGENILSGMFSLKEVYRKKRF